MTPRCGSKGLTCKHVEEDNAIPSRLAKSVACSLTTKAGQCMVHCLAKGSPLLTCEPQSDRLPLDQMSIIAEGKDTQLACNASEMSQPYGHAVGSCLRTRLISSKNALQMKLKGMHECRLPEEHTSMSQIDLIIRWYMHASIRHVLEKQQCCTDTVTLRLPIL